MTRKGEINDTQISRLTNGSRSHNHILWFRLGCYLFPKSLYTCRIPDFAWILRFVYSSHAIAPIDNTLVFVSGHIAATWRGEYIVPRALKRPVPVVVVPNDPELEATLTQQFRTVQFMKYVDKWLASLASPILHKEKQSVRILLYQLTIQGFQAQASRSHYGRPNRSMASRERRVGRSLQGNPLEDCYCV